MDNYATIVLRFADQELRLPTVALIERLIDAAPPFVTDPESGEAIDHQWARSGLNQIIKKAGPKVLRMFYGDQIPERPKGEDPIRWFYQHVTALLVLNMAAREWVLDVEATTTGDGDRYAYQVCGFHTAEPETAEAAARTPERAGLLISAD